MIRHISTSRPTKSKQQIVIFIHSQSRPSKANPAWPHHIHPLDHIESLSPPTAFLRSNDCPHPLPSYNSRASLPGPGSDHGLHRRRHRSGLPRCLRDPRDAPQRHWSCSRGPGAFGRLLEGRRTFLQEVCSQGKDCSCCVFGERWARQVVRWDDSLSLSLMPSFQFVWNHGVVQLFDRITHWEYMTTDCWLMRWTGIGGRSWQKDFLAGRTFGPVWDSRVPQWGSAWRVSLVGCNYCLLN